MKAEKMNLMLFSKSGPYLRLKTGELADCNTVKVGDVLEDGKVVVDVIYTGIQKVEITSWEESVRVVIADKKI